MKAHERLMNYITFPTASDDSSPTCPSTSAQLDFARALVREMKDIGIADAAVDGNGYVYGTIPGNVENAPAIGFIAHMDVVRDVPFENIKARIHENYDGGDIVLNEEQGIVMRPGDFPELKNYIGCDLVVTDGTTLLGADDKAGIAEILTLAERLLKDPAIPHGAVKIGFTPDEEIGRGADRFDISRFGADFAYTVDGAAFGTVEYENFNASSCRVTIRGKNIHPGSAKNKMKNALLMATEFVCMLPEYETPATTEGREGFYHLEEMSGTVEQAVLSFILRDFDRDMLEKRKQTMRGVADYLNFRYGEGSVAIEIEDSYRNMAEKIRPRIDIVDKARQAVQELGITPVSSAIRGGTDGATLSYMGLACPNLGTGSHNHHGKMEYAVVQAMESCVQLMQRIVEKYAQG